MSGKQKIISGKKSVCFSESSRVSPNVWISEEKFRCTREMKKALSGLKVLTGLSCISVHLSLLVTLSPMKFTMTKALHYLGLCHISTGGMMLQHCLDRNPVWGLQQPYFPFSPFHVVSCALVCDGKAMTWIWPQFKPWWGHSLLYRFSVPCFPLKPVWKFSICSHGLIIWMPAALDMIDEPDCNG